MRTCEGSRTDHGVKSPRVGCVNQTNKQLINKTIKSLLDCWGQVSGLDHNLLDFKRVWVIRVPGVKTQIT